MEQKSTGRGWKFMVIVIVMLDTSIGGTVPTPTAEGSFLEGDIMVPQGDAR